MSFFSDLLKRQSFQPSWFAFCFHPFFFIRRGLYKNIRSRAPLLKGELLDFGCGRKPFEDLFKVDKYLGVDIGETGHDHKHSKVDIYYDGRRLPFADAGFDALFCSEVLEHIFNPDEILRELNRVLRPGARALITVPFCWNEHEAPYDYARYSSFGIRHLLEKNGFRVLELVKSGNFARVCFQLWALYFFELFKKYGRAGRVLSMLFIAPLNLTGMIFLWLIPKNDSLYFNNIIVAEKVK